MQHDMETGEIVASDCSSYIKLNLPSRDDPQIAPIKREPSGG